MTQDWKSYEAAANKGPLALGVKIIGGVFVLVVLIAGIGYTTSWFGEAASVAKEEFGPRAMLEKYEWFKDASAQLDKKKADIQVYETRTKSLDETYKEIGRHEWPREDREQYNLWLTEVAGVKASFNGLAASYNSQMAKFNFKFANVGELPKGATEPLPREFKSYATH